MKKWKIWTGITLVFLTGVCIGAAGSGLYVRHEIRSILREGPPAVTRLVMKKLTRDLNLSGVQQVEVSRIVRETQSRLQELRLRNRPETEKILSTGVERVKGVLSPEQGGKLDVLYDRLKARWRVTDKKTDN